MCYYNLNTKNIWGILWRPEVRVEIDIYAANKSLYLLENIINPYTNSKKCI